MYRADETAGRIANLIMKIRQEFFSDHVISQNVWPSRSVEVTAIVGFYDIICTLHATKNQRLKFSKS